jgi:hypothetical protein
MGSPDLQALAEQLKVVDLDATYFAATLLGSEEGWCLSFQSRFVGWPDRGGPDQGVELREAAPVYPDRMTQMWDNLGQGWIVVTEPVHLAVFMRIGVNALIDENLARKYLRSSVEPREVTPRGVIGFTSYDPQSREVTHHRPSPTQRMRVLERDGFRCQLCGERPSENEHVVLHVHHIRPFGRGGLTADENLIILCHTCHNGLDPHEKVILFFLPGGHLDHTLEKEALPAFRESVETYRRKISSIVAVLGGGKPRRPHSDDQSAT